MQQPPESFYKHYDPTVEKLLSLLNNTGDRIPYTND